MIIMAREQQQQQQQLIMHIQYVQNVMAVRANFHSLLVGLHQKKAESDEYDERLNVLRDENEREHHRLTF
jgi:hypothetical protein